MPLRRPPTAPVDSAPPPTIGDLDDPSPDVRRAAALAQRDCPETIDRRIDALGREADESVRQALLASLVPPMSASSIERLTALLRSEDAGLRNAVITWFEPHGELIEPFLPDLLSDPDADVRILTLNLIGTSTVPGACQLVVGLLGREAHENVLGAALEAIGEVGDETAAEAIEDVGRRFRDHPFLSFAVEHALRCVTG